MIVWVRERGTEAALQPDSILKYRYIFKDKYRYIFKD